MSADLEAVAAELAIRNTVGRYIDGICLRDSKVWGATWSENAIWVLPNMADPANPNVLEGKQAIVAAWLAAMAKFPHVMQKIQSGWVEVDGDTATGRWYLTEGNHLADGSSASSYGLYNDEYVKENGEWLFSRREYSIMYWGPNDLEKGTFYTHPNGTDELT